MFEHVQPIIGPYTSRPAVCLDYDPRAADVAQQVGSLVFAYLPQVHVEHIGSTSAPGCAGKGIVDLMIPVPAGEWEKVKELFERLGFQRQPGAEPFPEDRPMRVGSWVHGNETFLLHIHLIDATSPEVEQLRFFRTCLRSDSELLRAYVARKRKIIASGVTDSLEYCRLKGEFLKEVLG
jgi:GrpB-like predicted nucleotidyltransferase (UPF0157 family)